MPAQLETLAVSWTFSKRYPSPDRPLLIAGDRIVGVVEGQKIYAVDIYSGEEVQTPDGAGFPYSASSKLQAGPVTADGAIFFVEQKRLKALEVSDGRLRPGWGQGQLVDGVKSLAAFPGIVVAILTDWDGASFVTAFRTDNGQPAWQKKPYPANVASNGAVACSEDALFFVSPPTDDGSGGTVPPTLVAINSNFGDVRFPKGAPARGEWTLDQKQAPLIGLKTVVCAGDGVYGFDRLKGGLAWSVTTHSGAQRAAWVCDLSEDRAWVAAVSSEGVLYALDTATGATMATLDVAQGGTPTIGGRSIYITPADHSTLQEVRLEADGKGWKLTAQNLYSVGADLSGSVAPVLDNGSMYLTTTRGDLVARPYATEEAAFFNGKTFIRITPDGERFHFGTADFTIEAWVRSSRGGEILSSYPGPTDSGSHGFRFNLGPVGEIRFAATNRDGSNQDLARTGPTIAADGFWHHVAAARKQGSVGFYLDGVLLPASTLHIRGGKKKHANGNALHEDGETPVLETLVAAPAPPACDISAAAGLAIGAYVPDHATEAEVHFQGLLREVRVWNTGLDAATVANRMVRILPPTVEHLHGNWHLDVNVHPETRERVFRIHNDVEQHEYPAEFTGGRSVRTDLALDDTAFPYLLHQRTPQWPYASSWIVRGQEGIRPDSVPAVSSDGVVCFATNNRLYGVRKSNGGRLWSIAVAGECSTPVFLGSSFYAVTEAFGLIRIQTQDGRFGTAPGFEHLTGQLANAAPAAGGRLLAAAGPQSIWVLQETSEADATAREIRTAPNPERLSIEGSTVYYVSGGQLFAIDTVSGETASTAVSSPVYCVFDERVFVIRAGKLEATDSRLGAAKATASAVTGSQLTGLSADSDAGLLVAATRGGELVGLSFGSLGLKWRTAIPDGDAPQGERGRLNAPLVDGRNVYCTSRSGAVAVVDGRNGNFRGLLFVPNAVVTAPVEDSGVAYFGCAETGPHDPLDGGLHTAVFGSTTALRLGWTPSGAAANGYARIERPNDGSVEAKHRLYFRDRHHCAAEAWICSHTGGEILSVCPSSDSGVGLRLWAERAGGADTRACRLHFQLTDEPSKDAWEMLQVEALVHDLLDGKWHHVAVSAEDASKVRIYLDGQAQDTSAPAVAATTPAAVASGLLAFLGADATAKDSAPANYFEGLIAEARLWDTYLPASEISHRMHMKLRGNEPDLLAYWNFDTTAVHDESRHGFDGALSGNGATFWLSDLHFETPDYPYLTTEVVATPGEKGVEDPQLAHAHYTLTVKAHSGDSTPLADHAVQFWYLRHDDVGEPAQITFENRTQTVQLTGIRPGEAEPSDDPAKMWTAKTGVDGEIVLRIEADDLDHGPSFDVRAAFMPQHERYHVDLLVNRQALTRETLPYLAAQAKLIQDYHWSPGSKIDQDRGRAVYRITLTVFNGDRTIRSGERLEVYATAPAEIEVGGTKYPVSPENHAGFHADAEGELTFVIQADDLKPASISVWAGFMTPDARYTVNPADDAHARLATVQKEELRNPDRVKAWKHKGYDANGVPIADPEKGSFLRDEHRDHAPQIAGAIRHVMAAGRPTPAPAPQALRLGAVVVGDAPSIPTFRDMAQRPRPARGDAVAALPTLRHINRRAPVTPESVLSSMRQENPQALGFSFNADATGVSFAYLTTHEEVKAALTAHAPPQARGPENVALGDPFSSAWDTVKSAAETAFEKARQVTVLVTDAVRVVIETADGFVHMAVRSIVEAVETVVEFLKKLALDIWMLIQFLLMMFDFTAIIKAHRILGDTFRALPGFARRTIANESHIRSVFDAMRHAVEAGADWAGDAIADTSALAIRRTHAPEPAAAHVHCSGVGARSMHSKAKENAGGMTITPGGVIALTGSSVPFVGDAEFVIDMLELLPKLPSMNLNDAGEALRRMVSRTGGKLAEGVETLLTAGISEFTGLMEDILRLLDEPIDIPFLSDLYEWITGRPLTLFNLMCLILAVAVHVTYLLLTGGREFCDDAEGLPSMLAAPKARMMAASDAVSGSETGDEATASAGPDPLPYGRNDSRAVEVCYTVFRQYDNMAIVMTDYLWASAVPSIPLVYPERDGGKVLRGLFGMTASCLQFLCSTPDYVKQLVAEMDRVHLDTSAETSKFYEAKSIIIFILGMAGDLISLLGGAKNLKDPPTMPDMKWDEREYKFLMLRLYVFVFLIYYQLIKYQRAPEFGNNRHSEQISPGMQAASKLLFARDLLDHVAKMPGFIFTRTYVKDHPSRSAYYAMTGMRFAAETAGLICHGVAEFEHLGH